MEEEGGDAPGGAWAAPGAGGAPQAPPPPPPAVPPPLDTAKAGTTPSPGSSPVAADDRRGTKDSKLSDWTAAGGSPEVGDATVAAHLVQRPWHRRFGAQFGALFHKNLLVQWRNARATILRILAPFFFMLLLFLVDVALTADNPKRPYAVQNTDPAVTSVGGLPQCEADPYIRTPCFDFFYTPNTSALVNDRLVPAMMAGNPGRPIAADHVLSFAGPADANAWLLANPERVLGGVHFSLDGVAGPGAVDYLLQVNASVKFWKDDFVDPNFYMQVPLQALTERAIASHYAANASGAAAGPPAPLPWSLATSMFAHPTTNSINIVGKVIGGFVFAANLFAFSLVLSGVVAERERGLRQALKTMGMLESAFWLSWMAVEVLLAVLFTLLLIAFGAMFQFEFFLKNSFFVVFFLFFTFQLAMVSVAFLLSTFLSRSSTAIYLGFVVFLLGWIIQAVIVFGFPYTPDYVWDVPVLTVIFTLMPWGPLAKACEDLGAATEDASSVGISWGNRGAYCLDLPSREAQVAAYVPGAYQDFTCVFPITSILWVLFFEWIVYFALAIYFDHVLADENGVRKGSPWYFLTPSYWTGGGGRGRGKTAVRTARGSRALNPPNERLAAGDPTSGGAADADVAAEERRMRDLLEHRTGSGGALSLAEDAGTAVEVFGLQKVFDAACCGGRGCKGVFCFCCAGGAARRRGRGGGGGPFVAVRGSWYAIERDQVFCLLGPNGAGKTTTINCLTGVLPPSGGDALVYGESISSPGGMDRVRALMGVCPQFDVLYAELSGAEHLRLYGRVKGLSSPDVAAQAEDLLAAVKLGGAAGLRTAAYSGGMRRRLSVAIALLGDPLLVYLDEPTTGMDPISRRHVWDIIQGAKAGRAIVLTTHSMEEADILGDKIAIMARGRVRAIGPALRLKQAFGSGYQLAVSVAAPRAGPPGASLHGAAAAAAAERADAVKRLFLDGLGVEPTEESRSWLTFQVPKDREAELPAFLQDLDARREELGVTDVHISLTSLEEVFLAIARRAELEAAAAEGRTTVTWELEDGSGPLEIGLGEEWAEKEGRHFQVKWAQDELGRLQVLSVTPADRLDRVPSSAPRGALAQAAAAAANGDGSNGAAVPPGAVEMARQ